MQIIVLVLGIWLLGAGTAAAFDCVNATLPSSIVICSDSELQQLADERQAAFNEARARLSEEQMKELFESQKAWVRSYAAACGVPPDRPPPIPVPVSVKECFRRAGEARITYIRSYGSAVGAPSPAPEESPTNRIGPGFDCSKAIHLFALLICADPALSRLDLRFNQAYWALYQQVGPEGQPELRQDDSEFIAGISEECGLPQLGVLTQEAWQARDCVENAYEQKRQEWTARLTGAAYQEAVRPPELAIALQRDLERLGFVPSNLIDGVYIPTVRAGIATWQSARRLPVTGLLGDADVRAIEQEASLGPPRSGPSQGEGPSRQDIPMEPNGGIYVVPVRINGALTLQFIVDSGASDVSIPEDVVRTLARTGTIAGSDFRDDETYNLGDGSTVKNARFVLRELQVGDQIIRNVIASIGPVSSVPLLGQSFSSRFTSWTLDNERHALVLGQQRPVTDAN